MVWAGGTQWRGLWGSVKESCSEQAEHRGMWTRIVKDFSDCDKNLRGVTVAGAGAMYPLGQARARVQETEKPFTPKWVSGNLLGASVFLPAALCHAKWGQDRRELLVILKFTSRGGGVQAWDS